MHRHDLDLSAGCEGVRLLDHRDVGDIDDTTPGNESPTRLRGHVSYIDDTPPTHSR